MSRTRPLQLQRFLTDGSDGHAGRAAAPGNPVVMTSNRRARSPFSTASAVVEYSSRSEQSASLTNAPTRSGSSSLSTTFGRMALNELPNPRPSQRPNASGTASGRLLFECPFPELGCDETFHSFMEWESHGPAVHFNGRAPPTDVPCGLHCVRVFPTWSARMRHVENVVAQRQWPANAGINIELYRCLWRNHIIDQVTFRNIGINPDGSPPSPGPSSGRLSQAHVAHGPVATVNQERRRRQG